VTEEVREVGCRKQKLAVGSWQTLNPELLTLNFKKDIDLQTKMIK